MNRSRISIFLISVLSLGLMVSGGCNNALGDEPPDSQPVQRVTITGTVTDPAGHPLPGVLVTPEPADKTSGPIPEIAIYTDKDGHFSWTVPSGTYDFVFHKPSYVTHKVRVDARPGKTVPHLKVRLKPS
ncbi:carboxypeptidase-like regulatory domain-containing protein [Laceyella putida]|uniref:Carboxypeptidase-like regulatory domain-containing protein n=1 Tax=Laceyella putida TaxID=110101 RepID=A0ABW2RHA4_9BACL